MTDTPDIQVSVKGFRAVANADIIINGITLVAGDNGSGKSSISKLLYYLYKTVANYDKIVKNGLYEGMQDILRLCDILLYDVRPEIPYEEFDLIRKDLQAFKSDETREVGVEQMEISLISLLKKLEQKYYQVIEHEKSALTARKQDRLARILADIIDAENTFEISIPEAFISVKGLVSKATEQAKNFISLRPMSVFTRELRNVFSEGKLPEKFEVIEYGSPIISLDIDQLAIPYNIQNAVYIDSPMMFHADYTENVHWQDLMMLINQTSGLPHQIADLISNEILSGEVIQEEGFYSTADFKFKREDGEVFNLLDVATGYKSFSIIQLLLKNGTITDKTLMIIDEPESNLHPQWIIEYARIIVLLHKQVGCKFFLASHNPDMVSAIRYISEKEGVLDKVNFYLAKKSEKPFQYDYQLLGKEIDPIFESFNIAIDRINQYGV